MSRSAEAWEEQQEQERQQQECEEHLHFCCVEALLAAKKIGLSEDHLGILCYVAGVDSSTLEN